MSEHIYSSKTGREERGGGAEGQIIRGEQARRTNTHKNIKYHHLVCAVPLVGPLRDPMACCSSDTLSRRTTSARADFSSWISSSCIWTLCSREAMRSLTSMLLAADALSSEQTDSWVFERLGQHQRSYSAVQRN